MRTGNAPTRASAANALLKSGPKAKGAILALLETLSDDTLLGLRQSGLSFPLILSTPAEEAKDTLARIGTAATEALIAALKGKWYCYDVAEVLGKIKDPRAVAPLTAALKDGNWGVRKSAVKALGAIGDKSAVEPLITVLKDDEDSDVHEAAAGRGADYAFAAR